MASPAGDARTLRARTVVAYLRLLGEEIMLALADFEEIVKREEPLAPYTHLKLGGPAEVLVQPRTRDELSAVVRRCSAERVPFRVLGSGCNLLIRDEGVRGVVLRL